MPINISLRHRPLGSSWRQQCSYYVALWYFLTSLLYLYLCLAMVSVYVCLRAGQWDIHICVCVYFPQLCS